MQLATLLEPPVKDLVVPGRHFVRQTEVHQWDELQSKTKRFKQRTVLLFTDAMLVAKKKGTDRYHVKCYVRLLNTKVESEPKFGPQWGLPSNVQKMESRAYIVTTKEKALVFFARDNEDKVIWVLLLETRIRKLSKQKHVRRFSSYQLGPPLEPHYGPLSNIKAVALRPTPTAAEDRGDEGGEGSAMTDESKS
jgi:hypothetical protein